ncbi:MAG: hypothetical protein ACRD22_12905 [Terriglobia bacterium]
MNSKAWWVRNSFFVAGLACLAVTPLLARAGGASTEELLQPSTEALPVGKNGVYAFPLGNFVDQQTAMAVLPKGGFILVYSRLKGGYLRNSRLWFVVSRNGRTFSKPELIPFEGEPEFSGKAVASEAFVTDKNNTWLYFESSDQNYTHLKLWRSRLSGTTFSAPVRLPSVPGLNSLAALPSWVNAGSDTYLTFRGKRGMPYWTRLKGGMAQGEPQRLEAFGVGFSRVVPMAGGGCFFSYQTPWKAGGMATYYRVSHDCSHWSAPALLSHQPNRYKGKPVAQIVVHDAYALPRLHSGVDVYYSAVEYKGKRAVRSPFGFILYRRSVMPNGTLGPVQLLTSKPEFYPFCASAHRLPDEAVLVTFSDIHKTGDDIYLKGVRLVTSSNLTIFKLKNDAPMPK